MDKRFFLALLLTGGVVLLTPVLFPRPEQPVVTPPAADSPPATAAPAATGGTQATAVMPTPTVAAAAEQTPAPVVPETVSVTNSLTTFNFSTVGARFLSAELPNFERLGNGQGTVRLAHGRDPMLGFRLIAGGDTLSLDQVPFAVARETTPEGERVTFTALRGASLRVEYTLVPDNYLARVHISASDLPQPAFLLTDLPTGFTSQEADSTEDARHLAYAYKPAAGGAERVDFRKPDPGERLIRSGPHAWAVAKSKYFLVGVLTPEGAAAPAFAELQVTGATRVNKVAVRAQGTLVSALPESGLRFELYAGPQEWERMVDMGRDFQNANPYGGWISGIIQPFATIVMRILLWMKRAFDIEYGWILVIFGVAVRVLMWPLNSRMMRSQIAMQRLAPKIQEAQNKFKGDPEKQRLAVMKVYQEAGVSPFAALSGCLPMLLPMPILIALFFVFQNTIEFRGVSFLWLSDISLKDPYYILPLAMGASMFLLSWVGMRNVPPNPQTKMLSYLMPVMLTVLLINFASGLNLYYTVQNLAALPQQWLIANERAKNTPPPGTAPAKVAAGGGGKRKA